MLSQDARLSREERARHCARFNVKHFGAAHVPVGQASSFAATERTQRRERSGRAVLAQLGPLCVNDHRPQVGLLQHTEPWAVQRGEQWRKNSSTVKAFVAFVQRDATPPPRPCRLLEEDVHVPSSCPQFQPRNGCVEGSFDGGSRPRAVALLVLRSLDAFRHGGTQPSHSACVSAIMGVKESTHRDIFPMRPLRQAGSAATASR